MSASVSKLTKIWTQTSVEKHYNKVVTSHWKIANSTVVIYKVKVIELLLRLWFTNEDIGVVPVLLQRAAVFSAEAINVNMLRRLTYRKKKGGGGKSSQSV